MGFDPNNIPPQMRRYMPAEHPESAAAQERRFAALDVKLEREMHEQFAAWLRMKQIPFVHSRMDKASTIREGWPDFTMLKGGRGVCIEFKLFGNRPSAAQAECIDELTRAGVPVMTAYTFEEAMDFVNDNIKPKG